MFSFSKNSALSALHGYERTPRDEYSQGAGAVAW